MSRKLLLLMLLALLIGTLSLESRVEKAKASGTIYIKADGSIDPPDAHISTVNNVTYTLTGNITSDADGIVVERDNIVFDGAGYTVQGTGDYESKGIYLGGRSNVTIKNTTIKAFGYGIVLDSSNHTSISGNNITANTKVGVELSYSYHALVYENNIAANGEDGFWVSSSSNNSIIGNNIVANGEDGISFFYPIGEPSSSNNSILGNNITNNNRAGIVLGYSFYSTILGNNITNNSYGIVPSWYSAENKIYHNNFVNTIQVSLYNSGNNIWDDEYPSGGNYWSDYTGIDLCSSPNQTVTGSDSIGDTPYAIDGSNVDIYPLMATYSRFEAGTWNETPYDVDFVSNSTVSDFHFDSQEGPFLKFSVTGQDGTSGFCRVTIPKDLLWVEDGWTVYVGEESVNYTIIPDNDYTYLYFTYNHSTKTVEVQGTQAIPEFPLFLVLPLFMIATLLAVIVHKRKHPV
jgi:parallel beta-helix repeat protein